jgi:ribonuclease G
MKKILINEEPWQTRVAIVDKDGIQNIYFWSHTSNHIERCFYKGTVTKVLPGIQTAFVDIGQEKAGFLHISEIDRDLAINKMSDNLGDLESTEKKKKGRPPRHQAMDIAKILKEGEEILVQVSKEPVNTKGAKLTTCFALPGRFLVLMPSIPRIGISKKIDDRDERNRLRDLILKQLPEGMGAIIRTSTEKRSDDDIKHDASYLVETWNTIQARYKEAKPQEKIYEDIDLSFQVVRDHLDDEVSEVILDNKDAQRRLARFVKEVAQEHSAKIKFYTGKTPLLEKYDVEKQIKSSLNPKVDLKSGGSIVIEATEAMTVVDVNTGRYTGKSNLEETIFKTNMEAAGEVTRQLKVRNIGGLIVIDFIDMSISANRQKLFRHFEKLLKEQDKFQSVLLKISEFGLVQMTRKRSGKTLSKQLTDPCESCSGRGVTPSVSAESYALLRHLKQELMNKKIAGDITIQLSPQVFDYISNNEYTTVLNFEKETGKKIMLEREKTLPVGTFKIESK